VYPLVVLEGLAFDKECLEGDGDEGGTEKEASTFGSVLGGATRLAERERARECERAAVPV
jgi:hypothetical protein